MVDMFMEIHKKEKNENTSLILMLGVLSEKLSEIIDLLKTNNKKFDLIKDNLELLEQEKADLEKQKRHMPLTSADYD